MKPATALRKNTLLIGFAAVLLPLVVLLALQYRWLVQLDHTSARAQEATLDNYLEAVADKVESRYRNDAERLLNVPPSLFRHDRLDEEAARYFKKKGVSGARRLFVASFVNDEPGKVYYFEPGCSSVTPPDSSPELRAVYVAVSPLATQAYKKSPLAEPVEVQIDQRDPEHRMILNPITDDTSRVVGVAGMILDESYFRNEILPEAVKASLPNFFSRDSSFDPAVAVWDSRGTLVFTTAPPDVFAHRTEAEKRFSFVYSDWRIALASRHATPGQVARSSFLVNLGLSAALGLALLGGLAIALRMASREVKLSQMKSDFVSNVSHELRTPLASIRVFGELLRLGRFDGTDKVREYGDYIETESRRLTQLINNLLDFASIESGRKSYRFEPTDVRELVCATLKTFEVRLRQDGFRVAFDVPAGPLPPVRLDPGAVAQSLSNLLDNAVKYSQLSDRSTGDREIRVGLRREGDEVVISVQDHGIGIPRDEQGKIFDRFHRVGTGLVHDVKGSGLGLAIVRHIAEAHHGRVTIESRVGEGSTFSLHLPIETPVETPTEAPAAALPAAGRRPSEA